MIKNNNLLTIGIIGDKFTGKTNILNIFNNINFNEIETPTICCLKSMKNIKIIKEEIKIIFL